MYIFLNNIHPFFFFVLQETFEDEDNIDISDNVEDEDYIPTVENEGTAHPIGFPKLCQLAERFNWSDFVTKEAINCVLEDMSK